MISFDIPYKFITQRVDLGWNELKFGLDHQLIKPKAAIDKADDQLSIMDDAPKEIIDLVCAKEVESTADLVACLAKSEKPSTDDCIKKKWLYLVLAWLFENREPLADPFGMVEEIYQDFDYPPEIASFVRYMPMVGPDLGNKEQNEARMFDYWKTYLNQTAKSFQKKKFAVS